MLPPLRRGTGSGAPERCPSVERYTPGAPGWEAMPPMRAERSGPGVAAVGGLLYAVGGSTVRGDLAVSSK